MPRRKVRRIDSADEDIPHPGPDIPVAKKEDSDDDLPLFGPNGLAEKLAEKFSQQEVEQESQQLFAPEDYLKEEVAGLSQEELLACGLVNLHGKQKEGEQALAHWHD